MRTAASPRDPVFYLHHAWIDLLWARWQAAHPSAAFTASTPGAGLNDAFMEWTSQRPADVMDHHVLGYAYDTEPLVTGPAPTSPDMQPGEVLAAGASISSAGGRYTFVYQTDGNLVLYGRPERCGPRTPPGSRSGRRSCRTTATWSSTGPADYMSGTAPPTRPGSRLIVQDDGNVVIYRPDHTPAWDTGTWQP